MMDKIKAKLRAWLLHGLISFKWIVFSIVAGLIIGAVGSLFHTCLGLVTEARSIYPWLLFLLPVGGIAIVLAYQFIAREEDRGTNLVLSSIQSGEPVPLKMAPLIFFSTTITHLLGGSAGREGAALQLGGSLGYGLGRLFRLDNKDHRILIMSGMSAAFSAVFGTPLAAAIFSMEVISVGIMHYSALVPCVIASLVAHGVAGYFGIIPERFQILSLPDFSIPTAAQTVLLAVLFAGVSVLFCMSLHASEHLYRRFLKNPYLRVVVGGLLIIVLTLLVGSQQYNGAGMDTIIACFQNEVVSYSFLLKILFTSITLGAGFKGGEIVPSFFIGATLGCLMGNLIGLSPTLCAAMGMVSVFCGVTNCPITSLFMAFELFGFQGMPYYLLSIAISYMLSGYYGLYRSQRIVYSKYKTEFVNRETH